MLALLLESIGGVLLKMLLSLLLDPKFLQKAVILLLEKADKACESPVLDKLLEAAKEEWADSAAKLEDPTVKPADLLRPKD